ncbi:MAG: class I SAM-dependent methyltransferase [Euryarchaeota archaeon]|nr:class I SAM-dependent methyltransferase [Euryarchaeota archaeon]
MKKQTIKDEVKDFYKKYPCGGDWLKDDSRYKILPWLSEVFEHNRHKGKIILDVGCGTGIDLLRYIPTHNAVVGIDISETPLKIAKRRINEIGYAPLLIRCDLENMPLKYETFDMVYSIGVLHHTPDHERGIREIHRVLKSDGEIIILLYHKYSLATLITKINRTVYKLIATLAGPKVLERCLELIIRRKMNPAEVAAFREMWEHPLIKYFTKGEINRIFKEVGFKNIQILTFDALYPLSRVFPKLNKIDVFQRL